MPCFSPITAYQLRQPGPNGKRRLVFSATHPAEKTTLQLPCGQCIGCRIAKAKAISLRCVHEASQYESNAFLTLTYDDAHLPEGSTLKHEDFQGFMKRLRRYLDYEKLSERISFYMCGEYGETTFRPHYHCLLFGFSFLHDRVKVASRRGYDVYTSPSLTRLWGKGKCEIGSVTVQSAGYCARYVMKKITGKQSEEHYRRVDPITGEIHQVKPEYQKYSVRPTIGRGWIDKFLEDVYPDDFCIVEGKKFKPPRYYDKQLEIRDPEQFDAIKERRKKNAVSRETDNTKPRREAREQCLASKLTRLKREL